MISLIFILVTSYVIKEQFTVTPRLSAVFYPLNPMSETNIPILQMRKLNLRTTNGLLWGHTVEQGPRVELRPVRKSGVHPPGPSLCWMRPCSCTCQHPISSPLSPQHLSLLQGPPRIHGNLGSPGLRKTLAHLLKLLHPKVSHTGNNHVCLGRSLAPGPTPLLCSEALGSIAWRTQCS